MNTELTKEEKQRRYEETRKRFKERNKDEYSNTNYIVGREKTLHRMCALYIITKPVDLWANNPFREECEKYNINDSDLFYHIPEYFKWLGKQNASRMIEDENGNPVIQDYEKITMNQVISTITKKFGHYSAEERKQKGIIVTNPELSVYLESIRKKYSDDFKYRKDGAKIDLKEFKEPSRK